MNPTEQVTPVPQERTTCLHRCKGNLGRSDFGTRPAQVALSLQFGSGNGVDSEPVRFGGNADIPNAPVDDGADAASGLRGPSAVLGQDRPDDFDVDCLGLKKRFNHFLLELGSNM